MTQARIVVIGAGHAGGVIVALLRQYGHQGPIALVGTETALPYQRPPLSKAWLKGEADAESLALKPLSFYVDNDIDLVRGVTATKILRSAKQVALSDGRSLDYDVLVLATGARAIPLPAPGAQLGGVLALRDIEDAERLKTGLGPGRRLAVIGGGYIGLEAAASARALGADVVVLEREARLLARVACPPLSSFFQQEHEARGVSVRLRANVTGLIGIDGRVTGVELADGSREPCDLALIGIGARPDDQLALACGLECDGGVVVDLSARTSDPAIFAIGDVTRRPLPHYGRTARVESVANALEQAKQAASAIVGRPAPAPEVPWQWSDQYDLKLQIAGLAFDADRIVVRGDPASRQFAVFHLRGAQIQAVEAVNAPAEFMAARQLIGARRPVDPERLADPTRSMKEVSAPSAA